jgi:GSH-dependent disulfide-bond oxidoreductase
MALLAVGGLGPMAGQTHHFKQYAREVHKHSIERYENETNRLHAVLNKAPGEPRLCAWRLFNRDVGAYPWMSRTKGKARGFRILRI